ncbi:MAG: adenylate/guanylate cyclase domain-containing protein [Vulcanimicrobiaceae bacterium]
MADCDATGETPDIYDLDLFVGVDRALLAQHIRPEMREEFDGGNIIRHGQPPEALYVIIEGSADIIGVNEHGREILIAERCPGEIVGEQSFIDKPITSADVRARGRVGALRIPAASVQVLRSDAQFNWNLLVAVSAKLRQATRDRTKHRLEQQMLLANFRSHVPHQFVDRLLNAADEAGKPQKIDAIIMFVDLRNFTATSRTLKPEEIAEQLAPYFDAIVDVVHKHEGIVDKYIGDAVMAVWGHPALPTPDENRLLDATQEMLERTAGLRFGDKPIRIGIGISCGTVFMGNVGTDHRRSFTVLGEPVNLAARYEGLNKGKDGDFAVTVGPEFYDRLNDNHQALLVPRNDQPVKGVPGDKQTVFSLKGAI